MDRLRGLLQPAPSERESPVDSTKSACPYCFLEIYVCDLRLHLTSCPIFRYAQLEYASPSHFPDSSGDDSIDYTLPDPEEPATDPPSAVLCPVCFSGYSRSLRLPIVLPECGHTLCQQCLRRISRESEIVKCPVCRAEHFEDVEEFPVNLAVMEVQEGRQRAVQCEAHRLEAVAFCEEHRKLLCGLCTFEHKEHNSFLLTSAEAAAYAERVKASLDSTEERLHSFEASWQSVSHLLDSITCSISEAIEEHTTQLQEAEARLVHRIRAGKEACIQQLQRLLHPHGNLQSQCVSEVQRLARDLRDLRENKVHFDSLPLPERLRTVLYYHPSNYPSPPSLTRIKTLGDLMARDRDYEEAIGSGKLQGLDE